MKQSDNKIGMEGAQSLSELLRINTSMTELIMWSSGFNANRDKRE